MIRNGGRLLLINENDYSINNTIDIRNELVYSINAIGNSIIIGSYYKLIKFDITTPQNKASLGTKSYVYDTFEINERVVMTV
jgi:hypothetical protein